MSLYKPSRFNHNLCDSHNLHTNVGANWGRSSGPSDIKSLIMYNKNSQILVDLMTKFLSLIKDKNLVLGRDVYCLLYNKEFSNKNLLLKEYPDLDYLEVSLLDDFFMNTRALNLKFSLEEIISIIKIHNSGVFIPGKTELVSEKLSVLAWWAYNTPIFSNYTITPLVGNMFPGVDLSDKSPSSIYKQWFMAMLMLTFEFNILKDCILFLESKTDLDRNILDIKDISTLYWLNRQLNIISQTLVNRNKNDFIVDYFSNKYLFYREVAEDLTYVLLNLILGKQILDEFGSFPLPNSEEFSTRLTHIIKNHYTVYSLEYEYLNQLRLLIINSNLSKNQILSISNWNK